MDTAIASDLPSGALERPAIRVGISIEVLVYLALAVLAIALRFADLDVIPMSAREVQPALAAWYTLHSDLGGPLVAGSPLVFTTQVAGMSLIGGGELGARIATALAGLALAFSPLLFRRMLGRARTLYACLLLGSSPVLLLGSRFSDPAVWTMLLAVLTLWALWRFRVTSQMAYGVGAIVAFGAMIFLTGPGAPLAALALALAGIVAIVLARSAIHDADEAEPSAPLLLALPWTQGIAFAALVIVVVATGFMLIPSGLSTVGELLGATLGGLTARASDAPPLLALLTSLFYEPFLWLFALIGFLLALRRGLNAVDRFFVAWFVFDLIAVLFFLGGTPGCALWLTLPLAALSLRAFHEALADDRRLLWEIPGYARWIVVVATFALVSIFSVSFQTMARSLSTKNAADGLAVLGQIDPVSMILMLMVAMFCVVGFFLAASVWNGTITLRGGLLGLIVFGLVTSLGAGWRAAAPTSDNPLHPWHLTASSHDLPYLRSSLLDVAKRESRGFPEMDVSVIAPHDGLVAWALRDFDHLHYYNDISMARGDGIVVAMLANADPFSTEVFGAGSTPDLGGSYVGQRVRLTQTWSPAQMNALNLFRWWSQFEINAEIYAPQDVVIWLRQDVYAGTAATQ